MQELIQDGISMFSDLFFKSIEIFYHLTVFRDLAE